MFGLPASALAFLALNPHSVGGYFYLVNLAVLWPVYAVAQHLGDAAPRWVFWGAALMAQSIWLSVVFLLFDRIRSRLRSRN